jgi:hypothetical protein
MTRTKKDPWTDPDPGPEDFEEYLDSLKPEDWIEVPAGTTKLIRIGDMDADEWLEKCDAAHARGELLPEEIEADERLTRFRQTLEQKQD